MPITRYSLFGAIAAARNFAFCAAFCTSLCVAQAAAQDAAQSAAEAKAAEGAAVPRQALSLDEAVATALSKDLGVISANLDWLSAQAKADSASWKRLPSLTATAGYTRLSDLQSSLNLGPIIGDISFGSLDNDYSFALNMQYPVFSGFRVKENIAISGLQVQAKGLAKEATRRALTFDVRKAYWEAARASSNRATLERNLGLMKESSEIATRQLAQGVATRADLLAAQMRLEQATENVNDARANEKRAFLTLAALTGADIASLDISTAPDDAPMPFELTTKPDDAALSEAAAWIGAAKIDAASKIDAQGLVSEALAGRTETRSAELSRELALHAARLARAALYPTVAVTGNYTYADPNQRAVFQSDPYKFTGTWALGLQMSFDLGGIPAALDEIKAQDIAASKAKTDEERQRRTVALDVENCIVALERARRDLASTASTVEQANENLRVMEGRVAAGTAKDIDLGTARFDQLRTDFSVTNRRIDVLIALADLARAVSAEGLK